MNRLQLNTLVSTVLLFGMVVFPFVNVSAAESPNTFNRLFIPPSERDTTLENDGIHDPAVSGLKLLQQPATALSHWFRLPAAIMSTG